MLSKVTDRRLLLTAYCLLLTELLTDCRLFIQRQRGQRPFWRGEPAK